MAPYTFAITQTMSKSKHKLTLQTQLQKLKEFLNEVFNKLHNVLYMKFNFELTQANVFHFHGYLTSTDKESGEINKLLYNEFAKCVGFCCIKEITNLTSWVDYMVKDVSLTIKKLKALFEAKGLNPEIINQKYITYERKLKVPVGIVFKDPKKQNEDLSSELEYYKRTSDEAERDILAKNLAQNNIEKMQESEVEDDVMTRQDASSEAFSEEISQLKQKDDFLESKIDNTVRDYVDCICPACQVHVTKDNIDEINPTKIINWNADYEWPITISCICPGCEYHKQHPKVLIKDNKILVSYLQLYDKAREKYIPGFVAPPELGAHPLYWEAYRQYCENPEF